MKSVLELGLSFCPSQANFNRETFVNDVFQFVRRLKLREFFSDKNTKDTSENASQKITTPTEDRSALGWTIKNPHGNPDAVREGRSVGLVNFIENSLHDFRHYFIRNRNKYFNMMKQLLLNLPIKVIAPADKGNGIVIMNARDDEKACFFETLTDDQYYEECDSAPNSGYRKDLNLMTDDMDKKGYISETENTILREGTRTPCFYGLP